jgi:hypothetical protein
MLAGNTMQPSYCSSQGMISGALSFRLLAKLEIIIASFTKKDKNCFACA